jgi:endonuclease/exonuclease/phosphatase (EEP) superfamily protein YafD
MNGRLTATGLLQAAATVACAATIVSYLAAYGWAFDLTTNFRPHYVLVLALATLASAIGRRWSMAAAFGGFAALNAAPIVPLYVAETPTSMPAPFVRLMLLNVFSDRCPPEALVGEIVRQDPDVLLLLEVDPQWQAYLAAGLATYPHRVTEFRSDAFGIALLSKTNLVKPQILTLSAADLPAVQAQLTVGGRRMTLLGVHAPPPVGPRLTHLRDQYLREVGARLPDVERPLVVLGDLNASYWSVVFEELVAEHELRNTALGWGLQGTWPSWSPVRVPIDHALVSPDLVVARRAVGSRSCSDHLPLVVDLASDGSRIATGRGSERVATHILKAIRRNRAVAPISAEAWAMYYLKRMSPRFTAWLDRAMAARLERQVAARAAASSTGG